MGTDALDGNPDSGELVALKFYPDGNHHLKIIEHIELADLEMYDESIAGCLFDLVGIQIGRDLGAVDPLIEKPVHIHAGVLFNDL